MAINRGVVDARAVLILLLLAAASCQPVADSGSTMVLIGATVISGNADEPIQDAIVRLPRARSVWPKALQLAGRLHTGGVRLLVGSETPNRWVIPGRSLHRELELLIEAGLTPEEALTAVTRGNAEGLGVAEQTGTIEVGKRADLVVLAQNPLENIGHTRDIDFVVLGGEILEPEQLLGQPVQ